MKMQRGLMWRGGVIAVLVLVFITACERRERPQGGKSEQLALTSATGLDGAPTPAPAGAPTAHPTPELQYASVVSMSHIDEVSGNPSTGPDGSALYVAACSACHQPTGQGIPGAFPPLDASKYVTSDNVDRLAAIMLYGLMGPVNVNGTVYNSVMLPQGKLYNDAQLAAIATYIRSSWSNKAGPVDAAVFAALRQKYGERAQFTIQELGEEQ